MEFCYQICISQNRTYRGFISNMYKILIAYQCYRILLHFGHNACVSKDKQVVPNEIRE